MVKIGKPTTKTISISKTTETLTETDFPAGEELIELAKDLFYFYNPWIFPQHIRMCFSLHNFFAINRFSVQAF